MADYNYDFQCHSTLSDGDCSPSEIIIKAQKNKLKGLILTDHNTLSGYSEFKQAADNNSIETIQGVEISTKYKGIEVHILAYSIAFDIKKINKILKPIITGYNERSKKITKILEKKLGLKLNFQELLKERPAGTCVTKYHIQKKTAQISGIQPGEIGKLLNTKGKYHVPYGSWAKNPIGLIKRIKDSNAVAIFAHPGELINRSKLSKKETIKIINKLTKELIKAGIDGIEFRHPNHTTEQERLYKKIIIKNNLLGIGSSDWHGPFHHPERYLGMKGLTNKEWVLFKKELIKRTGN
ncbi:PHP domain-containing protein [Patescibacteria group bacterium]|nr:PHP domain-containing protein [Patescibacteria group bacterium]